MFKEQAELTGLINRYINKTHEYGVNDCNILIADYVDLVAGTSFADKMRGQYSDPITGIKKAKQKFGYSNIYDGCRQYLVESKTREIKNGSVLLIKKKLGARVYYQATIVFNNKALIEQNGLYQMAEFNPDDFDYIFNRS